MNDQEIIATLKRRRKELHLTQKQLAAKMGVSFQYISQTENGERIPSITTLTRFCEALGLDIELKEKPDQV
jgi:transcriptional regulator with XRE-family HTH domain